MVVGWRRAQSPTHPNCDEGPGRRKDKGLAGDPLVICSSLGGPGWSSFRSDEPSGVRDAVFNFDEQH